MRSFRRRRGSCASTRGCARRPRWESGGGAGSSPGSREAPGSRRARRVAVPVGASPGTSRKTMARQGIVARGWGRAVRAEVARGGGRKADAGGRARYEVLERRSATLPRHGRWRGSLPNADHMSLPREQDQTHHYHHCRPSVSRRPRVARANARISDVYPKCSNKEPFAHRQCEHSHRRPNRVVAMPGSDTSISESASFRRLRGGRSRPHQTKPGGESFLTDQICDSPPRRTLGTKSCGGDNEN
jgi:hypothetical protein